MAFHHSHQTLLDNTRYARRAHEVQDTLNTLERDVPYNGTAFPHPKLVLLGSHGSGKSSLIEAITQIPVPYSIEGERCTKCPMEIHLRRGNEGAQWSCSVSVLRRSSFLRGANEAVHFDRTTNKADLGPLLQRAQLATFNSSNFDSYRLNVENPPQPGIESQISEDIIIVHIIGAAVELTLIDLPGFVDYSILSTVVENMAKRYVSQDMLNLVVIPAEKLYDVDRQIATKIARENDRQTNRTIGVFTKADTLEPGKEIDWINEFLIQRPSLIHGSFVTRNLFPFDYGTWNERRQQEQLSLQSSQWSQNEVNAYCGTEKLALGLGEVLDSLLCQRITNSITKLQDLISEVDVQLHALPIYFGIDPEFRLRTYCRNFVMEMTGFLYADSGEVEREIMSGLEELKTRIRSTLLLFDPQTETGNVPASRGGIEWISFAEIRQIVNSHRGTELIGDQKNQAIKELINRSVSKWPKTCLDLFYHIKTQILQFMESYGLELLKTVNTRFGQEIREKMMEILEDSARRTRESLSRICEQETKTPFTMRYTAFQEKQKRYANEVREWRQCESLRFHGRPSSPRPQISSELEAVIISSPQQPRALLQSDVQVTSSQLLPVLRQSTRPQQVRISQTQIQPYVHTVPNQQISHPERENNPRFELSSDPFEEEIQIMSNVVAYLELSVDRFLESTGMTIRTFWKDLGDELKRNLENTLNLTTERVARLALDDSDIRGMRKELTRRKSIFVEAMERLRRLKESIDVTGS